MDDAAGRSDGEVLDGFEDVAEPHEFVGDRVVATAQVVQRFSQLADRGG